MSNVIPVTHPIETESFTIIDALLRPQEDGNPEYAIVRRVVHATGDPAIAPEIAFSPGVIEAAVGTLKAGSDATLICDVNMVAAGITPTAARLGHRVVCEIGDPATASLAAAAGITRGAAGIRRAAGAHGLAGAVVVIGNAPTALFECLRLVGESGNAPSLVIGVPVGFVGAAESKQALMESGLEFVSIPGTRGGSNVAAAIANALMRLAREAGRG